MKTRVAKQLLLSSGFLAAGLVATTAEAHSVAGSLGSSSANNVDVYHTTCFSWGADGHPAAPAGEVNGPASRIVARISKGSGSGTIKVSLGKIGLGSLGTGVSATDATTGGTFSSFVTPTTGTGNGEYTFVVSHSAAVSNTYTVEFHCEQNNGAVGSGSHTGTGVNFDVGGNPTDDYNRMSNQ
jgi:hypothetical protein